MLKQAKKERKKSHRPSQMKEKRRERRRRLLGFFKINYDFTAFFLMEIYQDLPNLEQKTILADVSVEISNPSF